LVIKQSGSDVHVFTLAFEHMEKILNTNMFDFCTSAVTCLNVANSGHFMFSGELTKLVVTFAYVDRFYGKSAICLRLEVAFLMHNLIKIPCYLLELRQCIQ